MGLVGAVLKKGMGFEMDGYVFEGKYPFTGVRMQASNKKGIIKDSDYDTIVFYSLSDTIKDQTTGYGIVGDVYANVSLNEVASYEKSSYDNDFLLIKIFFTDGDYTTVKLPKNSSDTSRFEKVLYTYSNKNEKNDSKVGSENKSNPIYEIPGGAKQIFRLFDDHFDYIATSDAALIFSAWINGEKDITGHLDSEFSYADVSSLQTLPGMFIYTIGVREYKFQFAHKTDSELIRKAGEFFKQKVREAKNPQMQSSQTSQVASSPADEILKYKALLDQGIISQEEFEIKKNECLRLPNAVTPQTNKFNNSNQTDNVFANYSRRRNHGSINLSNPNISVESLLKRSFIFIEDKDYDSADEYLEAVLDMEPENGKAYLGKFLIKNHCKTIEQYIDLLIENINLNQKSEKKFDYSIKNQEHVDEIAKTYVLDNYLSENDISNLYNFDFGYYSITPYLNDQKEGVKNTFKSDNDFIRLYKYADNNTKEKFDSIFQHLDDLIKSSELEDDRQLDLLKEKYIAFLDETDKKAKEKYEEALSKKDADYNNAIQQYESTEDLFELDSLAKKFLNFQNYKQADVYFRKCQDKINEINKINENKRKRKNKIAIIVLCCLLISVFGFFAALEKTKKGKYNNALSLINDGKFIEAYEILINLQDYEDSFEKASEIYPQYLIEKRKNAKSGDYIVFGSYEQDNNISNGKEDIEWLVLKKEDNQIFVISKYALDCRTTNSSGAETTWEASSLRYWLNGTFINDAFNSDEQRLIQNTLVTADTNLDNNLPENDTYDKVFLLSITEASSMFVSDRARQCCATEYAISQGSFTNSTNGNCWWWLRSPVNDSLLFASVSAAGTIYTDNDNDVYLKSSVRPALWIKLE